MDLRDQSTKTTIFWLLQVHQFGGGLTQYKSFDFGKIQGDGGSNYLVYLVGFDEDDMWVMKIDKVDGVGFSVKGSLFDVGFVVNNDRVEEDWCWVFYLQVMRIDYNGGRELSGMDFWLYRSCWRWEMHWLLGQCRGDKKN